MSVPLSAADLTAALPDVTSTLQATGLLAPVEIVRDTWGIPHVRAQSEHDVFFAQGFVTAQDRLWQMDYDRQRALGCWSELVGAGGLAEDQVMRTFGLERASKADYTVSSANAQMMFDAYTAGVNAFIATTATLPVEYQLLGITPQVWESWHCLAVYKIRNMLMGTFEMKLWRTRLALKLGAEKAAPLFRSYPSGELVAVPPGATYGGTPIEPLDELSAAAARLNWLGEVDGGSNAWAISGDKTASGLPIVAGDSHRALDTPSVYYQTHLSCPTFKVSGYAVPGVPGAPHFSHTAYVGWGMTHGYGDYQDLYIERFRTTQAQVEYETAAGWRAAEVTDETIKVRDGETVSLRVVRTQHGPVIAGDPANGNGLAFQHTGTRSGTPWPNTFYDLLLAKSADEAEEALREWTEPVNNFVYADIHGEFGYRYRGRVPVRSPENGWAPVPGWEDTHEWQGQIPFSELPRARNPDAGFVVTCNNAPTTADYPHYINTFFAPDHRARRITTRLQALEPGTATVADMASIHADRVSIPAGIFVSQLRSVVPGSARTVEAIELLQHWDCRMDRNSGAAALYGTARSFLFASVIKAAFGDMASETLGASTGIGRGAATHAGHLYASANAAMAKGDTSLLAPGQTWPNLALAALEDAVAELDLRLGTDMSTWSWGAIHHTRPRHPLSGFYPDQADVLDPPPFATHGDGDTPLAGGYSLVDRFVQTLMSVNRYIFDPSDWRQSRWIVPLGASGHPGSPHFADQGKMWSDVETIPQLWDWDDIVSTATTRQTLNP